MPKQQNLDLSTIFKAVTKTLVENQQQLNEADTYNHDHGDNMVQTFKTVQSAISKTKGKTPSEQLAYAGSTLEKKSKSGSAQIYAKGLKAAAKDFEGKQVTPDTIGILINSMMGMNAETQPEVTQESQLTQSADGDLLTSLLGSLTGQAPQPQSKRTTKKRTSTTKSKQQPQSSGGDLIDMLLGGLGGSTPQEEESEEPEQGSGDLLGSLIGSLLGGEQSGPEPAPKKRTAKKTTPQPESGDLLGDLLGGLVGGSKSKKKADPEPEDLIGSLLEGLSGRSTTQKRTQQKSDGLEIGTLLSGALCYYAAKRGGRSNLEAIIEALTKSSPLGRSPDRAQSGALIINTLLGMMGNAR